MWVSRSLPPRLLILHGILVRAVRLTGGRKLTRDYLVADFTVGLRCSLGTFHQLYVLSTPYGGVRLLSPDRNSDREPRWISSPCPHSSPFHIHRLGQRRNSKISIGKRINRIQQARRQNNRYRSEERRVGKEGR